jgi:hypothetical protein
MERNNLKGLLTDCMEVASVITKGAVVGVSYAAGAVSGTADQLRSYKGEIPESFLNKSHKRLAKEAYTMGYTLTGITKEETKDAFKAL